MDRLIEILKMARPHGGAGERRLADMLAKYKPDVVFDGTTPMAYVVFVGTSRTVFSAHLDTAEREDGEHALVIEMVADTVTEIATDGKSILGADDGAGVWLLMEMIEAGVPGCYIFTVGEERGGVGAKYVADTCDGLLGNFDRAVAFDRRGIDSVITHQAFGRCCSDDFANALSNELNEHMQGEGFFAPDDTGTYTDTAEYVGIIPECTNISVGYRGEHTCNEALDVQHLIRLRNAVMNVDWESLPTVRDPAKVELDPWWTNRNPTFGFEAGDMPTSAFDVVQMTHRDLVYWIEHADPREIASLMYEMASDVVFDSQLVDDGDDDENYLSVGMR